MRNGVIEVFQESYIHTKPRVSLISMSNCYMDNIIDHEAKL